MTQHTTSKRVPPRETWVPVCPQCGSGHIIVASKAKDTAPLTLACYECKCPMMVQEVPYKRL